MPSLVSTHHPDVCPRSRIGHSHRPSHSPEPSIAIKAPTPSHSPPHTTPLSSTPHSQTREHCPPLPLAAESEGERAETLCEAPRRWPPSPTFPWPPFPLKTYPLTSVNPLGSFPYADFAGNSAVEPLQGAPPSEEEPVLPAGAGAPALETPPEASPTPCCLAADPADLRRPSPPPVKPSR
jgi:hypothetical protein